jgi:hypothetical protein
VQQLFEPLFAPCVTGLELLFVPFLQFSPCDGSREVQHAQLFPALSQLSSQLAVFIFQPADPF